MTPTARRRRLIGGCRTNLLYAVVDEPPRVILVSSPGPQEGKSTTCANLAVVLGKPSAPPKLLPEARLIKVVMLLGHRSGALAKLAARQGRFESSGLIRLDAGPTECERDPLSVRRVGGVERYVKAMLTFFSKRQG